MPTDLESFFSKGNVLPSPAIYQRVLDIFKEGERLPTFPETLQSLQKLLAQENVTVDSVADLVGQDVGLSAQLIRLANSPMYRGFDEMRTIHEALIRIGLREVRSAAASAAIITEFRQTPVNIDWKRFWTHSLLVARLTERICQTYRSLEGGEYLAGLLHDVGKLVMFQHMPAEFERVLTEANQTGKTMFETENELFGLNHAQIGGALCLRWNLHPKVWGAVLHHHEIERGRFWAACIHVADQLANGCHHNIHENKAYWNNEDLVNTPGWQVIDETAPGRELKIPLSNEFSRAQTIADAFLVS